MLQRSKRENLHPLHSLLATVKQLPETSAGKNRAAVALDNFSGASPCLAAAHMWVRVLRAELLLSLDGIPFHLDGMFMDGKVRSTPATPGELWHCWECKCGGALTFFPSSLTK